MSFKKLFFTSFCAVALTLSLFAQEKTSGPKLNIVPGPTNAKMNGIANLAVPADCVFLDANSTRTLLKASGDQVSGKETGMVRDTNGTWSAFFEYDETGHIMDNEKEQLDAMADKLLQSYKEGAAEQNKERAKMGAPPVEVTGWEQKPHYDDVTHNLTWAIRGTIGGEPLLNYNTRLLGRVGVMEVVLACEPNDLPQVFPSFTNLLAGYTFTTGQTYAEYRPGDKIAKYGLAALVLGGAGVAAAKLGLLAWVAVLFKKAWKLIAIGIAAIATSIKKLYARITGRKSDNSGS